MFETTTREDQKLSHFLQNNDPIAYINNTLPLDAYPSSTPLPYLQKAAYSINTYIMEVSVKQVNLKTDIKWVTSRQMQILLINPVNNTQIQSHVVST
jgi:hypothetical protein